MSGTARESIWTRPDRRSRGPVPQHNRSEIVAAALVLADEGGLPAVSMRAVAAAMDTGAGSLYRYLSSRDDLLDLMADSALGELPLDRPLTGEWLDDLVGLARDQLALYRRHPWLTEAARRPGAFGPNTVNYFERCLAIMADVPSATSTKMEAVAVLTGVVSLFALSTQPDAPQPDAPQSDAPLSDAPLDPSPPDSSPGALPGSSPGDTRAAEQQQAAAQLFSLVDPEKHPHLTAAFANPAAPPEAPDLFERTIRSVLRGLLTTPDPTADSRRPRG